MNPSKEDLAAAEKWAIERGWTEKREDQTLPFLAGIRHGKRSQEQECARLRAALELIATPKRSDGTYNRCREACEQLAREALDPKEHGGVGA